MPRWVWFCYGEVGFVRCWGTGEGLWCCMVWYVVVVDEVVVVVDDVVVVVCILLLLRCGCCWACRRVHSSQFYALALLFWL